MTLIQTLLTLFSGANLNHQDFMGRTPLMAAVESGHQGIVEILLSYGADPDILDASFVFLFI